MASWTGFLLLATISVTLLDLTEGLTCYSCKEVFQPGGPDPEVPKSVGRIGRDADSNCFETPIKCEDGGVCAVITLMGCKNGAVFEETTRLCFPEDKIDQAFGNDECRDTAAFIGSTASGATNVMSQGCYCQEDNCNDEDYLPYHVPEPDCTPTTTSSTPYPAEFFHRRPPEPEPHPTEADPWAGCTIHVEGGDYPDAASKVSDSCFGVMMGLCVAALGARLAGF